MSGRLRAAGVAIPPRRSSPPAAFPVEATSLTSSTERESSRAAVAAPRVERLEPAMACFVGSGIFQISDPRHGLARSSRDTWPHFRRPSAIAGLRTLVARRCRASTSFARRTEPASASWLVGRRPHRPPSHEAPRAGIAHRRARDPGRFEAHGDALTRLGAEASRSAVVATGGPRWTRDPRGRARRFMLGLRITDSRQPISDFVAVHGRCSAPAPG